MNNQKYLLTVSPTNRNMFQVAYDSLSEARKDYKSAISQYHKEQSQYDGIQLLSYVSIDRVEGSESNWTPVDYLDYMDGAKLEFLSAA